MAKSISGEATLQIGKRRQRLRLDIGTMIELEDYFNMGLVPFLSTRLPEFRLKDMSVLYLAMTGKDFSDETLRASAVKTIINAGLAEVATAISTCLERTLMPTPTPTARPTPTSKQVPPGKR